MGYPIHHPERIPTMDEQTMREQLESTWLGRNLLENGFPVAVAHKFTLYLSSLPKDSPAHQEVRRLLGFEPTGSVHQYSAPPEVSPEYDEWLHQEGIRS